MRQELEGAIRKVGQATGSAQTIGAILSGLTGFPQISLPLMTVDGAPMGLSLMGPPGSDRALIALSASLFDTI